MTDFQISVLLISPPHSNGLRSITVHNQRAYVCGFNLQASYTAEPQLSFSSDTD